MKIQFGRIAIVALVLCLMMHTDVFAVLTGAGMDIDDYGVSVLLAGDMPLGVTAEISGVSVPMETMVLTGAEMPIRTVFLIDVSENIREPSRRQIVDTLETMIERKETDHLFAIHVFGESHRTLISLNSERFYLDRAVRQLQWVEGSGGIVPSIYRAYRFFQDSHRDVLTFDQMVIFSDGIRAAPTGLTHAELLIALTDSLIIMHTVGFLYEDYEENNEDRLSEMYALSRITGGFSHTLYEESGTDELVRLLTGFSFRANKVRVAFPEELRDGSVRPLELRNEAGEIVFSYNVPMPLIEVPAEEPIHRQEMPEPIPQSDNTLLFVIIAVLGTVIVGGIVVVIIVLKRKKPEPVEEEIVNYDATMPIKRALRDENIHDSGNDTMPLIPGLRKKKPKNELCLTLSNKAEPSRSYVIKASDSDNVVIGRQPDPSGCVIECDERISRKHCTISNRNKTLWVEDLGSANYTYVNDKALDKGITRALKSGDELTLAGTTFLVHIKQSSD